MGFFGVAGGLGLSFSILKRIELGETKPGSDVCHLLEKLSVSSNGSNWVKRQKDQAQVKAKEAFSILKRIELGETPSRSPAAYV